MWREGITNAEFKKWPKAELLKFHEFVTSNMECKPGDPADLRNFKKTITSCTLAHGTPTDYVTTSWNDPNVLDLHRPQILPYKENPIAARMTPRKKKYKTDCQYQREANGKQNTRTMRAPTAELYSREQSKNLGEATAIHHATRKLRQFACGSS